MKWVTEDGYWQRLVTSFEETMGNLRGPPPCDIDMAGALFVAFAALILRMGCGILSMDPNGAPPDVASADARCRPSRFVSDKRAL
jgi:hypothetical protein